jgi:hypothetical protein
VIDLPELEQEPQPESAATQCPCCGSELLPDVALCLECGYDLESGEQLEQGEALTDKSPQTKSALRLREQTEALQNFSRFTIATGILVLIASFSQIFMSGPTFLFMYFLIGLAGCVAILMAHGTHAILPLAPTLAICFVAYELIGAIRWWYGVTQGMHRFTILMWMMILGPAAVAVALISPHVDFAGGGGGGGCGGGGCGGGGCGGGGCGGCGG